MENGDINFFGLTSFRNQKKKFGIKIDDRRRHFYTIGKTGMGKSNLMENMAIQDIQAGRGIAYVDPHGEGAEKLLDFVPAKRINDVVFFNPADLDHPIAFNVMEKVDFKFRHLVAGGLLGVFKKIWPDVWSARMEYILNNSILALLEYPDSTLLGINRMLADPEYREKVVSKITDPIVKSFWVTEYARYTQRYEIEATAAIQNKVGQFISNPLIRNIVGQTKSSVNMRKIMDEKKILILDLSKGRIGEENSRLLGALMITKLQLAAMSRVDIPENERKDFYLYVDEFQNFATESFASILSEARKYRLNLIMGHQYITQMDEIVRDAVFGNVGTLAVFRVGAEDAEFLEREFTPEFTAQDLVNLGKYNIYLKLMIDGVASHPFSAQTLPPPEPLKESNKDKIIKSSRERYGIQKNIVEDKIMRWTGLEERAQREEKPFQNQQEKKQSPKQEKRENNRNQNRSDGVSLAPKRPFGQSDLSSQVVLYDAVCSNCGRPTKVIFKPEKDKPVYCKSCLKKLRENFDDYKPQKPEAGYDQEKNIKIENISFSSHRGKQENIRSNEKPKRKEINLSELRKALEKSLENREEGGQENEEAEKVLQHDKNNSESQNNAALQQGENKNLEEENKPQNNKNRNGKKGAINPGETIRF